MMRNVFGKEVALSDDPEHTARGIAYIRETFPTPWKVDVVRCGRGRKFARFAILDANGREVKIIGQAVRHAIVDAMNSRVI